MRTTKVQNRLDCTFIVRYFGSIIPILAKSKISRLASLCSRVGRFESYLIGNLKDRFSRDEAHISSIMILHPSYVPNFEEVEGAYWSRVVRPWVHLSRTMHARVLNFINGFLMEKYLTHAFFLVRVIFLSAVMPL